MYQKWHTNKESMPKLTQRLVFKTQQTTCPELQTLHDDGLPSW